MRAVLLAAALFLAACGSKPAPAPAAPAPEPVATSVAPVEMPAEGDRHEIRVERDKVVVVDGGEVREVPDLHTAVDAATLKQTLDELDLASAPVVLSDDAAYGRAVAAMVVVNELGGDPSIVAPPAGDDVADTTARDDGSADMKDWPLIVITPTAIELRHTHSSGNTWSVPFAGLAAGSAVPDLEAMLSALAPFPGGVIVQANADTSGQVVNRVLRSIVRVGIPRMLLAVKTSNSPVRRP